MTDQDRYFLTFDRGTHQPVGVFDAWHSPEFTAGRRARTTVAMSPTHRAALLLLALSFAAGLYGGALLFGDRSDPPPTVVFCPGPGSPPVAALPAECGPPQGVGR
ncbi:hypothetical protein [Nocardia wallacei]|uniref:hypothetical protein n=2 Tax=Nocardia wallacei TaxID=480035 RepID=UPI002454BB5D|nr:hypothetical protein [Nocardia wallacei]